MEGLKLTDIGILPDDTTQMDGELCYYVSASVIKTSNQCHFPRSLVKMTSQCHPK